MQTIRLYRVLKNGKNREIVRLSSQRSYFGTARVTGAGIIRDINSTGAKLEMNNTAGIPNHFGVVTDDDKSCYVRVMWRTKEEMGIRSIKRPD